MESSIVLKFCLNAAVQLAECKPEDYAALYVRLHDSFYYQYHKGFVFSTRLGLNIFRNTTVFIISGARLEPVEGETELGPYDKNYNEWLDSLTKPTKV